MLPSSLRPLARRFFLFSLPLLALLLVAWLTIPSRRVEASSVAGIALPAALPLQTAPPCETATFAAAQNYGTGDEPSAVAVGDFNGDDKPDIATANRASGNVSVLLNNGSGGFLPHVNYAGGAEPIAVALGDLNGDGKTDIVAALLSDDELRYLSGNGDGTFNDAGVISIGSNIEPQDVAVGDFNGDNKADLAVSHGSGVRAIPGNGDGTFPAGTSYEVPGRPDGLVLADFNSDNKLDIAVANSIGKTVSVLLNNGDGTFQAHKDSSTGADQTSPRQLAAGDFNEDNKFDVVVANNGDDEVVFLEGNNDGTFQSPVIFPVPIPSAVAVGDFNKDDHLDLAVGNIAHNEVVTAMGYGDGSFRFGSLAQHWAVGERPEGVAVGDFNDDGKLDIVSANRNTNNVSVLLNNTSCDADSDGRRDNDDNCPNDHNPDQADFDRDGQGDACDADDDNDGEPDVTDCQPHNASAKPGATEVCNGIDDDCDGTIDEGFANFDGDSQADCVDTDDDNDNVPDAQDAFPFDPDESVDTDGDGIGNNADTDDDNDGQSDLDELACGSNHLLATSKSPDNDGDNKPDCVDPDDDNDGVADTSDNCRFTANPTQADFDRDGIGDACDPQQGPPVSKEQCKNTDWKRFDLPRPFKNQGDCVQYVNTGK